MAVFYHQSPGFVPRLSATPDSQRRNAPALGQDTDPVLREVELTEAQIAALRESGVVGLWGDRPNATLLIAAAAYGIRAKSTFGHKTCPT